MNDKNISLYNTDPAERHVTALCCKHFINLSVSQQSDKKQDKFFPQTQFLALIRDREVKFTHFLRLYVGNVYCKLPLYNLMARYPCRIVLEELSMSMKTFSQYRLLSGKHSNFASVEYKSEPLPHSHFPNSGIMCNSIEQPHAWVTSSRLYPLVEKLYKKDEFIRSYADSSSVTRAAALIAITEDFSHSQESHCGISSPSSTALNFSGCAQEFLFNP